VKAVRVDSDKFSRASATTPMFETGKVFFPENVLPALTEELLAFPVAAHDDLVDALVHGLNYLRDSQQSFSRASQWAESLRNPVTPTPATSPTLRAYERSAVRGSCTVCYKAIHQAKLVQQPDGTSIHEECLKNGGKPGVETIRGESWPGASPFNLIPHNVRL